MQAISVTNLSKAFNDGTQALKDVSFRVSQGEMVALIGASGSGKSTLIRHIAGLVCADNKPGCIEVFGKAIQENGKISKGARNSRSDIGVVFQQFNLVARLSVLTNVLMGVLGQAPSLRTICGIFTKREKQSAMQALARVGMGDFAARRSSSLSGGQQQRAAIARTIVQGAKVILADEPVASLDPASAKKVMDNLNSINQQNGTTILVSLHQVSYAKKYCQRTIAMRDGQIVFDGASQQLTPAFLRELYGDDSIELMPMSKQQPLQQQQQFLQQQQPQQLNEIIPNLGVNIHTESAQAIGSA